MVEKNLKKLKAKKRRVMNGFNTGTRDMKLKTAYQRKKKWSAEDADHYSYAKYERFTLLFLHQNSVFLLCTNCLYFHIFQNINRGFYHSRTNILKKSILPGI